MSSRAPENSLSLRVRLPEFPVAGHAAGLNQKHVAGIDRGFLFRRDMDAAAAEHQNQFAEFVAVKQVGELLIVAQPQRDRRVAPEMAADRNEVVGRFSRRIHEFPFPINLI